MADPPVLATQLPQAPQVRKASDVGRWARRFFWPRGLSVRLMIVTVLFVAGVGLLALPSSLGQYEDQWLYDRVRAGELASLAVDAAPNQVVSDKLARQLLTGAGVVHIAVQSHGVNYLYLQAADKITRPPYLVDLRQGATPLSAPFETLFGGSGRMVLVRAKPSFRDGDFVEIVAPDAPLKKALEKYLLSLIGVAAIFTLVIAGALYLLLNFFFVRPIQRITRSMEHFRVDPEDASTSIHPSGRRDEIGRAESELERMQGDLRAALSSRARLAALGQAVAKINHDLRNMLTSAQIASDRLAQSGDPKVAQAMPRLERALDRAVKLASHVLDYGKSEEPAPAPTLLPLAPAVEAAAEDAGLSSEGVRLVNHIDADARVQADADQLHRILVNLLRNGREAIQSDPGVGRQGELTVSFEAREGQGVIRIADNGPGVPERLREKLFEPFAGSGRPGGAGLGLAIARELAQAHGGDIALTQTGPLGSVFEVRLPTGPGAAEAVKSRGRRPPA